MQSPSQEELEQSIGESAAQGAAGVVVWVSSKNTSTKVSRGLGGGVGMRGDWAYSLYPRSPG